MRRQALVICAVTVLAGCSGSSSTGPTTAPTQSTTSSSGVVQPSAPESTRSLAACPPTYSGVVALEASSGHYRWNVCGTEDDSSVVLGADQQSVYLGSISQYGDAVVIVLDAVTGDEQFRLSVPTLNESFHLDALYARGVFAGDGVVVLNIFDGSTVFAVGYDAHTGDELWREPDVGYVIANGADIVVVAEADIGVTDVPGTHRLYRGLDRRTGRELWSFDEAHGSIPSLVDGLLVLPRLSGGEWLPSLAIDIASGKTVWESDAISGLVVRAGESLVGLTFESGESAMVEAVDATAGVGLWDAPAATDFGPQLLVIGWVPGRLVGDEALVYVEQASALAALDAANGEVVWSTAQPGLPVGGLEAGPVALFADDLRLLNASDGSTAWTAMVGDTSRVSNVVVADDSIYVSWN